MTSSSVTCSTLWACDFFTETVWTLRGPVDYFVLFFLQVGTRKIQFFNLTAHPTGEWMVQQARNFLGVCQEWNLEPGYLLHDQDSKFTASFEETLRSGSFKPKRLPAKVPNLNPYAESWVGTIRRECLDHFIVLGERTCATCSVSTFTTTTTPSGPTGRGEDRWSRWTCRPRGRCAAKSVWAGCSSTITGRRREEGERIETERMGG